MAEEHKGGRQRGQRLVGQKLSARTVATLTEPGRYGDGLGLWLHIGPSGAKSWVYRYRLNGKDREMGLGPVHTVTLAEARAAVTEARKQVRASTDPLDAREAARVDAKLAAALAKSFRDCAGAYIEAMRPSWKNAKHADQWANTLATYAFPVIGDMPIAKVDTAAVLRVLEPIWTTKTETASRLRGRIESVLDWAKVRGYRAGDNPAAWKGHLAETLPARSAVQKVEHHAALPYSELGAFMALLRAQDGASARALEFAILAAARTGEVLGATWAEFDTNAKVWTIPAERMKAKREHRVPLSDAALHVIETMRGQSADYVFPGRKPGSPLSSMALLMTLRRMERADLTAHGFRSTFKDWASECTAYPNEVSEMALAHAVGDKVEAAYRRGDLFDKRHRLMTDWADWCARPMQKAASVTPIRAAAE